jgi:hypothetical protein
VARDFTGALPPLGRDLDLLVSDGARRLPEIRPRRGSQPGDGRRSHGWRSAVGQDRGSSALAVDLNPMQRWRLPAQSRMPGSGSGADRGLRASPARRRTIILIMARRRPVGTLR